MRKSLKMAAIGLAAMAIVSTPAEAQRGYLQSGRAAAREVPQYPTVERAEAACGRDEVVWVNPKGDYYRKGSLGFGGSAWWGAYTCLADAKRMNLRQQGR